MLVGLGSAVVSGCAGLVPEPEPPLACGAGDVVKTRGWPEGGAEWCESSTGVRNGPARMWSRGFSVKGTYRDGDATGRWTASWPNGRRAGQLDFTNGVPHGRLIAWYEDGRRTLAEGVFEEGRVRTPVVFFDTLGRARYRLDAETMGPMDGHAFDERGVEVTPDAAWLPTVLPKAYELLIAVVTLIAQRTR